MDRGRVSVLVYHGKPETSVQVRKGQLPRISEATYIGYELRSYRMDVVVHQVAQGMKDEISCTCALLHDVVEDTDVTFGDIEAMGFPKEVTDVVVRRIICRSKIGLSENQFN